MKTSKKEAERTHARRRLYERFGLDLPLGKAKRQIIEGRSTFVRRVSNRVSIHKIVLEAKEIIAVYDGKRKEIVTFLYPEGKYENQIPTQVS